MLYTGRSTLVLDCVSTCVCVYVGWDTLHVSIPRMLSAPNVSFRIVARSIRNGRGIVQVVINSQKMNVYKHAR